MLLNFWTITYTKTTYYHIFVVLGNSTNHKVDPLLSMCLKNKPDIYIYIYRVMTSGCALEVLDLIHKTAVLVIF